MTTETTIRIETPDSTLALIAEIGDGNLYEPALTIYPEEDSPLCTLDICYGAKPGQATDAKIWHGRVLRAWLWQDDSSLGAGDARRDFPDAEKVRAYLTGDEGQSLLRRVVAGYSCEWDGNNHVGLLNDDAITAYETLVTRIQHDTAAVPDGAGYWDAGDWFDSSPIDVAAEATDADLDEIIAREEAEAATNMVVIGGLRPYLERRREEAREEADDAKG